VCNEGQKWLPTTVFFEPAAVRSVCRNAVCCMCVLMSAQSAVYTHNTHCECERVQRIDFSRAVAFPAEQQPEFCVCVCERRVSRSRRKILAIQVACLASVWPAVMAALQCSLYTIRTAAAAGNSHGERAGSSKSLSCHSQPYFNIKESLIISAQTNFRTHNHRAQTPF